ncbi:hypothetical protein G6F58_013403 [Rhizopus delemar]|nr:hypothetical protein G6F58_013403 [Rhizopus delemar]
MLRRKVPATIRTGTVRAVAPPPTGRDDDAQGSAAVAPADRVGPQRLGRYGQDHPPDHSQLGWNASRGLCHRTPGCG